MILLTLLSNNIKMIKSPLLHHRQQQQELIASIWSSRSKSVSQRLFLFIICEENSRLSVGRESGRLKQYLNIWF